METYTPRRSVDSHSRQKYRSRLTSELSVIVTCSRTPFLDPVLMKSRSSKTLSLKCIQSQSLSPNTSSPRNIQWKLIKTPSATSRRPCTHARPAIPRTTAGEIGGTRRDISCRRHVFHLFPRPWNTSTQLRDEMIQNTQCAFSLSKTISSRPTALPRILKVPHPSAQTLQDKILPKTSTRKNVCSKRFLVHRSDEDLTSLSKERSLHQWRIHRCSEILRSPWFWQVCVGSVINGDTLQEQDSEKSVLLRSLSRRQSRD